MNFRIPGPTLLRKKVLDLTLSRFLGGELFLVGILLLADLFSSMWRFLAMEAPAGKILLWVLAGLPAHAVQIVPVALLFGITLALAEMHADGEMIVACGSGISVQSLSLPLVLLSVLLSGGIFLMNDLVTVPSSGLRDQLFKSLTGQKAQANQIPDIALLADSGKVVYRIGRYDPLSRAIFDVDIVVKDGQGGISYRLLSPSGRWAGDTWVFSEARIFLAKKSPDSWTEKTQANYSDALLNEAPESFGMVREKPGLLTTSELGRYLARLELTGLPTAEAATEYHKRFSFLLTPLIVCGLSVPFAGLFRKNTLLMSLLFSLGMATVYYVAQMLGSLAAKTGWLPPWVGIWSVTIVFMAISTLGFFKART